MAKIEFDLQHGLELGKEKLTHVELGELTAGDIIEAQMESERVVNGPAGPVLVSSPALSGVLMLCRQIKRLGNIAGPLELDLLKKLHEEDLLLLEVKATELGNAAAQAAQEMQERGRAAGDGAGD